MKNVIGIFCLSILLVWPLSQTSGSQRGLEDTKERIALVIGNSKYKKAPLKNPVNDARDMAATLSQLHFTVIHKENATLLEMKKAISNFGIRLNNGRVGLFYFAGHGMQVNGQNYLFPVDAVIETESDVEYEAVNAGRILGKMEDARNEVNIVILDACRDNPFARSFRSQKNGLAKLDAPTGTIIAYATAPGSVAADGSERNGIYTKHLLRNIKLPQISVEEMFKRVRIQVLNETQQRQVPWESSSLTGYFYFNEKDKGAAAPTPAPILKGDVKQENAGEKDELEALKKELENERKKLEYEKQLAAIRNERNGIKEGSAQKRLDDANDTDRKKLDGLIGSYDFSGNIGNRKKGFTLIISKSGNSIRGKAVKTDYIRWSIEDFDVTSETLEFVLNKMESGARDTFRVHARLTGDYTKIPVELELIDTDNPYSRVGFKTTALLTRY